MTSTPSRLRRKIPFLSFVACTFAGIGIGYWFGNLTSGTLIGLGAGLIVMVLLRFIFYRRKEVDQNPSRPSTEN